MAPHMDLQITNGERVPDRVSQRNIESRILGFCLRDKAQNELIRSEYKIIDIIEKTAEPTRLISAV